MNWLEQKKQQMNRRVLMTFLPKIGEVWALGEFNNWSTTTTPLKKGDDGRWELRVPTHVDVADLVFFVREHGSLFGYLTRCRPAARAKYA